jgi:hypothetical protein
LEDSDQEARREAAAVLSQLGHPAKANASALTQQSDSR